MELISSQAALRPTTSFPDLRTPKEIAALLKVSVKTIYYWIKRNEIPYIRMGKHVRFEVDSVLDYFQEKTEASKPACFQRRSQVKINDSLSLTIGSSARLENFACFEKE